MRHDYLVDIKGMCCSAPVIRLAKEFARFQAGDVVLVLSDKSSMLNDIPAWCNMTGNELLKTENAEGMFNFWIGKR